MTEKLKNQQREYEAQQQYRQHVQQFIDKFRYKGPKRAAQVIHSTLMALNLFLIVHFLERFLTQLQSKTQLYSGFVLLINKNIIYRKYQF